MGQKKTEKKTMTLRVKEASSKDVGRAIARLDPEDMKSLGLEVGDIIEIKGKRAAPAKVMPCYSEFRGKRIIQIDGVTRDNAKVGLDEKARIAPAKYKPAAQIRLFPLTGASLTGGDNSKYVGSLLAGLPLTKGDRVRATLFGTRFSDFQVEETTPQGIVVVEPKTSIKVEVKEKKLEKGRPGRISYEDIGGLETQTQRIREMIELPLRFPEVFERLGIDAPKGVFLHGPPGCGKTLIARAVANETDAYFVSVSGPEIMGKFYGESEGRLRGIFEEAQSNAPAIIFIDEIESIAPKREDMGGEKQVERRVVAQLLALMDGLESRGHVIVLGATNLPNTVDPALRRPGRFDREIAIPIPDRNARLEILEIHTRGMPLAEGVDLKKLADITHGFVGADLEALAREAAMSALRRLLPKVDFDLAGIPYETLMELEVKMDDFSSAMKEIEPSAIREVFVEIPDVHWDEVGGLEEIKEELQQAVVWPLKYAKLFEHSRTEPATGLLLVGPPGTGKTLAAKALATESGVNFISIKGPEMISKYIGESERAMREIFKKARMASPCILFFDEIDSLIPVRGRGSGDSQVTERVISQFLTELGGIEQLKGVVVIGATNRIDVIDPAILRPGRFDVHLNFPLPDKKTREIIFKIHTKGKSLSKGIDFKELAGQTEGFSGAAIEGVCRRASMLAVKAFLKSKEKPAQKDIEAFAIGEKYFEEAIALLKGQKGS